MARSSLSAGGGVIMQRLDLRGPRLGQCRFRVQHIQLRARAGSRARVRLAQRFLGFLLHFFLGLQHFLCLDEIGIRRAHVQFNLA